MSNFTELYDYFLGRTNIEIWPTEADGPAPITIEAVDFFAWLDDKGYVADYCIDKPYENSVCLYIDVASRTKFWETWAEWWSDPRVISSPGKFSHTTNLIEALLCEYLNDPANPRFTDCRTVADLPTEFLTSAEKAAKQ